MPGTIPTPLGRDQPDAVPFPMFREAHLRTRRTAPDGVNMHPEVFPEIHACGRIFGAR